MPLPLLFIGLGAAGAALGIGKGIKAGVDTKDANDTNRLANNIVNTSIERLKTAQKRSSSAIENLGKMKVNILNNDMQNFITSFEKLKNVDFSDSVGLDELKKFKIDKQAISELKKMTHIASDLTQGMAGGAAAGALTAFGAWGAASTFAAASTGTAIASLSGAAATNATLAFFGGGALAAGGLGMAGGAAVLGGLIAGPALAVAGFVFGAKASKNKDNAYANLAEARKYEAEYKTTRLACNAIRRRSYMFYRLLIRIDALFAPLISTLNEIISSSGDDYSKYSETQKHSVAAAASVAGTVKSILDTAILTEDGKLTEESEKIGKEIAASLDK